MSFIPEDYSTKNAAVIAENAMEAMKEKSINLLQPEVVYTVAVKFLKQMFTSFKTYPDSKIPISTLMTFGTENTESENGEKAGNIVPTCTINDFAKKLVKDPEAKDKNDTDDFDKTIQNICENTMIELKEINHVDIKEPRVAYITIVAFMKEVLKYLSQHNTDTIVLGSLMNISVEDGSPRVELGEQAKLLVKNDDATEEDEEY